ncbi:hypothetical protein [Gimesia maris]|uniref:hypothetical protein n=1 Tax=Gimesia maris TaxID=122 RepID=UPI0032F082A1
MIRELLREAYEKNAEPENDRHPHGSTTALKPGHLPPDVLEIPTLDVDEFPAFVQVELQNYYLDLTDSNYDVAVYRLGGV